MEGTDRESRDVKVVFVVVRDRGAPEASSSELVSVGCAEAELDDEGLSVVGVGVNKGTGRLDDFERLTGLKCVGTTSDDSATGSDFELVLVALDAAFSRDVPEPPSGDSGTAGRASSLAFGSRRMGLSSENGRLVLRGGGDIGVGAKVDDSRQVFGLTSGE